MIRALIFDCFGVLYIDPIKELEALTSPDKRGAFQDLRRAYDYGYVSKNEYLKGLAEMTGRSPEELEHLIAQRRIQNEPLLGQIATLKRCYKIVLLSNMGREVMEELFDERQRELFDAVIVSSEVGMTKPDPEVYRLAANRVGVETAECVMIDDSDANCQGAEATGMQSILYENGDQCLAALKKVE